MRSAQRAGYAAKGETEASLKYRDGQARVPAGQSHGGRWTDGDRVAMGKIIQGAARYFLRHPKVLKPAEKTLDDLLRPSGKELGIRKGGATSEIGTIDRSNFEKLKSDLLDGTTEVPAPTEYTGKWFRRSDGSIIGVRISEQHGETLEVIKSLDGSALENGCKVHFK